jgi:hypothetical protein
MGRRPKQSITTELHPVTRQRQRLTSVYLATATAIPLVILSPNVIA